MVAEVQANLPDDSLLSASLNASNNKNKISVCGEITKSGNYTLGQDIHSSSGVCINIHDVKNVFLNCNNHKISADYSSGGALNVKNVNNFSIQSCVLSANMGINNLPDGGTFPVLTPSFRLINSNNGVITKNNIQGMFVNRDDQGPIPKTSSTNLKIDHNTFNSGGYDQMNTSNSSITYNNMSLAVSENQTVIPVYSISTSAGSNNLIAFNNVDGGWDSVIGHDTSGADNGVAIGRGEKNTIVKNNTLKNFHNAGIETPSGFVSGIQIIGNTIDNAAHTGILSFWQTSWLNNTVEDNIVTNAPSLFWFERHFGLWPGEKYMYFLNNTFKGNSFSKPKYSLNTIIAFNFQNIDSSNGDPITVAQEKFGNNIFTSNNFGGEVAPQFLPSNMIVDGGGNICGSHGDDPYPLNCNSSSTKIYSSQKYGFSLQYPTGTQINANATTVYFLPTSTKGELSIDVVMSSSASCFNTASGSDPTYATINGINFTVWSRSKEYSTGSDTWASAKEYCVVHSGSIYKIISKLPYKAGTTPSNVDQDTVLNKMIASFKLN
jgi:hypothetical protein